MHHVSQQDCLFIWSRRDVLLPRYSYCAQSVIFFLNTDSTFGAMNLAYALLRFVEREHQRQDNERFHVRQVTYQMDKEHTFGMMTFSKAFEENLKQVRRCTDLNMQGYHRINAIYPCNEKLLTSLNVMQNRWMDENFVAMVVNNTKCVLSSN